MGLSTQRETRETENSADKDFARISQRASTRANPSLSRLAADQGSRELGSLCEHLERERAKRTDPRGQNQIRTFSQEARKGGSRLKLLHPRKQIDPEPTHPFHEQARVERHRHAQTLIEHVREVAQEAVVGIAGREQNVAVTEPRREPRIGVRIAHAVTVVGHADGGCILHQPLELAVRDRGRRAFIFAKLCRRATRPIESSGSHPLRPRTDEPAKNRRADGTNPAQARARSGSGTRLSYLRAPRKERYEPLRRTRIASIRLWLQVVRVRVQALMRASGTATARRRVPRSDDPPPRARPRSWAISTPACGGAGEIRAQCCSLATPCDSGIGARGLGCGIFSPILPGTRDAGPACGGRTMVGRLSARAATLLFIALSATGCFDSRSSDGGGGGGGSGGSVGAPNPIGPVAHDAAEAWPERPEVAPITREQIAEACVLEAGCAVAADPNQKDDALLLAELCVGQIVWSAERAIPLSGLWRAQERAERRVACVLAAASDCTAVIACTTGRDSSIDCEEDGCKNVQGGDVSVVCDGAIASISGPAGAFSRDCALAFAECDPESPTGCTDRHFSACPAEGSKADRCDGNVRLGCDGAGQVSYHDCERMGGTCATTADGRQDCIYQVPADVQCSDPGNLTAACSSTQLSLCVLQKRVTLDAPALCPSSG